MNGIINEDVLLEDCIKGVAYYAKVDKKRAAELAKTNLLFIAEEMYEAQDAALRDIARKESHRKGVSYEG